MSAAEFNRDYKTFAVSSTDVAFSNGAAGKLADVIDTIVVTVATSATGTCSFKDGSSGSAIPITAANTPLGVYTVKLGIRAKGASGTAGFYITTGAGATAVVTGRMQV